MILKGFHSATAVSSFDVPSWGSGQGEGESKEGRLFQSQLRPAVRAYAELTAREGPAESTDSDFSGSTLNGIFSRVWQELHWI